MELLQFELAQLFQSHGFLGFFGLYAPLTPSHTKQFWARSPFLLSAACHCPAIAVPCTALGEWTSDPHVFLQHRGSAWGVTLKTWEPDTSGSLSPQLSS